MELKKKEKQKDERNREKENGGKPMEASSIETIRNGVLFMPVDIIVECRSKGKKKQDYRKGKGGGKRKMVRKSKNT